jgi:hypothetical protein
MKKITCPILAQDWQTGNWLESHMLTFDHKKSHKPNRNITNTQVVQRQIYMPVCRLQKNAGINKSNKQCCSMRTVADVQHCYTMEYPVNFTCSGWDRTYPSKDDFWNCLEQTITQEHIANLLCKTARFFQSLRMGCWTVRPVWPYSVHHGSWAPTDIVEPREESKRHGKDGVRNSLDVVQKFKILVQLNGISRCWLADKVGTRPEV